jgi:RHS repeat-associated protein
VTTVSSLNTGSTNYSYDATGNLIERDGDVYRYNGLGKLKEITTAGGDVFSYTYDAGGNRIKKTLKNASTTTYTFNNLYEVFRSPGEPEKHTMYIPGIAGDMVAQYTRSDALLVQTDFNEEKIALADTPTNGNNSITGFTNSNNTDIFDQRRNFQMAKSTIISIYREIETDIAMVTMNLPKPKFLTDNNKMFPGFKVIIWILAFGMLVYYALTLQSENPILVRFATSLALFPFFFAMTTGCSPLFFGGAEGSKGTPPWLLLVAVPANTPSVSDDPSTVGTGGGGEGGSTNNSARITGMFFYHPDHLGSVTMITDGRGNVLAGGERGGKSHISYKPYGDIHRTDSFGPDISKYKYTGQEEDKESGLMYYKARYYDAKIGRFLQADTVIDTQNPSGMNKAMYTYGNPINYSDFSGNSTCAPKGGSVWGGQYIGPGAGGCAGTLLYSDFTDFSRAANPRSPLFLFYIHFIAPNKVSSDTAMLYWSLNYLYNNPKDKSQSKADEISIRHDQEFKGNPFSQKSLKANGVWIDRNVKSLFNANDWQDTYNREKNALSERKTPWGKKRGKYGDATSTIAVINTLGTRLSDLVITISGAALFTLGGDPTLIEATIYATNADKLKIKSARFNVKL